MWGFESPLSHHLAMNDSRYARQQRLPQVGEEGQEALSSACVAVIGLGALGSVGADLLCRAGVGRLLLIDRDVVETSNLQRQVLYDEEDAELVRPKTEAARLRLSRVNREVALEAHAIDLNADNIDRVLQGCDLILDGSDNFAVRYLLNDFAVEHGLPYVYAGVVGTYGMVGALQVGGPCLRCTWPEPPEAQDTPTCRSAGVLGPAVSVIAGWAAAEALRILLGAEETAAGYRYLDVWTGRMQFLKTARDPQCPCCSNGERPWLEGLRGKIGAQVACSGEAVQLPGDGLEQDLQKLGAKLAGTVENLQVSPQLLRFAFDGLDLLLFPDGRILVRGTDDVARARAVLARTVGA